MRLAPDLVDDSEDERGSRQRDAHDADAPLAHGGKTQRHGRRGR